jgi:hypothetical protein
MTGENLVVQDGTLLNENIVAFRQFLGELDIVSHLAFEADIGDKSVHVLGIDTRGVGSIGIAIGVSVFAVE